jgi:cytochrome c-type biogenesis protein CcmH
MIFWIATGGLLLLALIILVPPILKAQPLDSDDTDEERQRLNIDIAKDKKAGLDRQLAQGELNQEEYDNALVDLQTALALDLENVESVKLQEKGKWAVVVLAVVIPLMSLGLYFQIGEYRVIENPSLALAPVTAHASGEQNQKSKLSMSEVLELLQERLRANPDDAEGWYVLGRTFMAQQQYDQAIPAFQKTLDLVGEEPGVLFSMADATATLNGGSMQGEPEQLVKRGLAVAPMDPTGLWLNGLAAEQRQDYQAAYTSWTRLLPLIQSDPASSAEVNRLIKTLEQRDPRLATLSPASTSTATATAAPTPVGRTVSLSVNLAENMRQGAAPDDLVFVYAKAMSGPPMPLAVKRLKVRDLPTEVTLSDSDAMIPSMKLSSFEQIVLGARISKSGNPVAQAGDLFTEISGIDSSNPPPDMVLSIDQVK